MMTIRTNHRIADSMMMTAMMCMPMCHAYGISVRSVRSLPEDNPHIV